ncbi:septal ring lytic transglycosylase RlpA family protein [Aurantimonas sp. MSK8Z-1]|nr:septal ring lytic transglycosylase RlpA family protein [Aurantimonas sp. CSK15Z-1]MCW4114982.1 septal ring lytic transglycosylase RlpA family protein [Aurantimonas sp. MSK8Z-1]
MLLALSSAVTPPLVTPAAAKTSCGGASWYALNSRTASGEMMNPDAMTAAHRTLALGTRVRVTNLKNGRTVVVRINDRGPFIKGRVIDLSRGAARKLGFIQAGHTRVQIQPADSDGGISCA